MERRDAALFAFLSSSSVTASSNCVAPTTVVAEIWRDPPRHQNTMLLEAAQKIRVLDDHAARAAGTLLGITGKTQIVDAHVSTIAVNLAPSLIVTSDPKDMRLLITARRTSRVAEQQ